MKLFYIISSLFIFSFACEGNIVLYGTGENHLNAGLPEEVELNGTIKRENNENNDIPNEDICRFINPGKTPLRRLTRLEYNNSVQDLFPTLTLPIQVLIADERVGIFKANTTSSVDQIIVEKYMGAAESIAQIATRDMETFCNNNCDVSWAQDFAQKAYRRPLNPNEKEGIADLFNTTTAKFNHKVAVRLTIEAILQSSSFLYRVELGEDPDAEVTKLTEYEVASRLSYFIAGTLPDQDLIDAANAGGLNSPSNLEAQARRLIALPKSKVRINSVMSTWLGIEHITGKEIKGLNTEQQNALLMESQAFIDHVMWEGNATLNELLTADYGFVSKSTQDIYGVKVSGDMEKVSFTDDRQGILGQPSFLASHGHGQAIVHRGKFIKDAFLCLNTQAAPKDVKALPTFVGESDRSKAEKRIAAKSEGCANCHSIVDGLGKFFDTYDSIGKWRESDTFGNELTSKGEIVGTDVEGKYNNLNELATAMAKSEDVRSCVTRQFLSYSLGRVISSKDDACTLLGMQKALDLSNGNLKEMMISIVKTDAFRYRRKLEVGGEQ